MRASQSNDDHYDAQRELGMHSALRRRLKKHLGAQPLPEWLEPLLKTIDEDYAQSDQDRLLLERSLELTSQELMGANKVLRSKNDELVHAKDAAEVASHAKSAQSKHGLGTLE